MQIVVTDSVITTKKTIDFFFKYESFKFNLNFNLFTLLISKLVLYFFYKFNTNNFSKCIKSMRKLFLKTTGGQFSFSLAH